MSAGKNIIELVVGGSCLNDVYKYSKIVFDSHVGMSKSDAINDSIEVEFVVPVNTKNIHVTWTPLESCAIEIISAKVVDDIVRVVVAYWGYRWTLFIGYQSVEN